MADHASILSQHWTDILPPSPPPSLSWWLIISAVALFVLVVLVVFILWQYRPRSRARRVLRRCYKQLQVMPDDARRIAYAVYHALLSGLKLNPATDGNATRTYNPQWQVFYLQLQQCVFQATPPTAAQLATLIQQGRYWLRHYPQ